MAGRKIEISGNTKFSDSEILRELLTKVRPWYLFWEAENNFDPITFREDLGASDVSMRPGDTTELK